MLSKEILLYTGEEILKEDMQVCLLVLGNKLHKLRELYKVESTDIKLVLSECFEDRCDITLSELGLFETFK